MTQNESHSTLGPKKILVTERYSYLSHITGIKHIGIDQAPEGLVSASIPYEKLDHSKQLDKIIEQLEESPEPEIGKWLKGSFGGLHIGNFGYSNLQKHPEPYWDDNILPLRSTVDISELRRYRDNSTNFDINFKYSYCPTVANLAPLSIQLRVKDENYFGHKLTEAGEYESSQMHETLEHMHFTQVSEQIGLKRNLILEVRIYLILPDYLSINYQDEYPKLKKMTLSWPLSTPHYMASLSKGTTNNSYKPFINPEKDCTIFWKHIPFVKKKKQKDNFIYTTDYLNLEISEPAELYQYSLLSGSVSVEINGLLSGLNLIYLPPNKMGPRPNITFQSKLTNKFTLNIKEGLRWKEFSPSQLLQFPGVVLDDMRLADIMMLLEDKGFDPKHVTPAEDDLISENDESESRMETIIAARIEGGRIFKIVLIIEGKKSQTSREREITGEEKYTTSLQTGNMSINIEGILQGDRKRVVSLVNELQKQLKEHFHHVSRAE